MMPTITVITITTAAAATTTTTKTVFFHSFLKCSIPGLFCSFQLTTPHLLQFIDKSKTALTNFLHEETYIDDGIEPVDCRCRWIHWTTCGRHTFANISMVGIPKWTY